MEQREEIEQSVDECFDFGNDRELTAASTIKLADSWFQFGEASVLWWSWYDDDTILAMMIISKKNSITYLSAIPVGTAKTQSSQKEDGKKIKGAEKVIQKKVPRRKHSPKPRCMIMKPIAPINL